MSGIFGSSNIVVTASRRKPHTPLSKINLTDGGIGSLETSRHEEFGGGYGTGAAVFRDLCVAPGRWDLQDALDPFNARSEAP
ncbi:MAG: hypothetical protein JXR49_05315 [Acidobacteria bacterium]|nr:hypothetical protein [Acidobacteriota bacterium]